MIKKYDSKIFGGCLQIEFYESAQQMCADLEKRTITDVMFKKNPYLDARWVGATREEAYEMLRTGYQPVVEELKANLKAQATGKRFSTYQDVAGFQPIIPNAIMGLPNSMINSRMKPIKTKVIDVYYENTASHYITSKQIMEAGAKMLSVIQRLEAQGYRFNLYVTQGYYRKGKGCDMLCLKVKSANQPMDLKRMSFPIAHTAFFRGMGFDWYSKVPGGKYRDMYGYPVTSDWNHDEVQSEYRRLLGKSAVYFSAMELINRTDTKEYVEEVLTNGK